MNKREVSELKKQFSKENCSITKIHTCYVDHEKNIVCSSEDTFLLLPEEEQFKYLDIFKKTLSGSIGKTLSEIHFSTEQEESDGTQRTLYSLAKSQLKEKTVVNTFLEKIVENYEYVANYIIVLIHAAYDVPGKTKSGDIMDDASEDVFEYVMCSICPVKLSKPGLAYNEDKNMVCDRTRDWIVDKPIEGFLYPAFTDRSSDIHSVLVFQKKNIPDTGFTQNILGCSEQLTPEQQSAEFKKILNQTLCERGGYEIIKNIHDNLENLEEKHRDESEPLLLNQKQLTELLGMSGVSDENIQWAEKTILQDVGKKAEFHVANLMHGKQFDIHVPNISIKVKSDFIHSVETKQIDGRTFLMIPVDGDEVEVNGTKISL